MTYAPAVRLDHGGVSVELPPGSSEIEIPEGKILFSVSVASCPSIELDDAPMSVSWHQNAKLAIWSADLTNQVGFHRLTIRIAGAAYVYDFRTCTTKATWDEVRSMAEVCASSYLGYRRQFTYMSATGAMRKVRLPQVHYAWLRDRLPEIEKLVRSINERPATSSFRSSYVSPHGKDASIAQTNKMLREKHQFLECSESGPIQVGERAYWPSHIVSRKKQRQPDIEEHTQIATFLMKLSTECRDLVNIVAKKEADVAHGYLKRIDELRALAIFRSILIRPGARPTSVIPTSIARTDRRYRRMRDLRAEYGSDISDSVNYERSIRTSVKDVSYVYQTFVAHVIGNALGLTYYSEDKNLRTRSPERWSMGSDRWHLYFDVKPNACTLDSWRNETERPANERPDIILSNLATGRRWIMDAKFKTDDPASSRATQADLFEMQGYMNSFATKSGAIIFPGHTAAANLIAARGNSLLELPIRASHFQESGDIESVHQYVRDALNLLST